MKNISILAFLFISFVTFAKTNPKDTPGNDQTDYSKVVTVHGMVCAFCSNSLEKKLKKEDAVDQVKIDLTNKKVSILFKKGKSIEDKKLKEIVTASGFKFVKVESTSSSK